MTSGVDLEWDNEGGRYRIRADNRAAGKHGTITCRVVDRCGAKAGDRSIAFNFA